MSKKLLKQLCLRSILMLFIIASILNISITKRTIHTKQELPSIYEEQEIIIILNSTYEKAYLDELLNSISSNATILDMDGTFVHLKLPQEEIITQTLHNLNQLPEVKTAEPNYVINASALTTDTYTKTQWALQNSGNYRSFNGSAIKKIPSKKGVDLNIAPVWDLYYPSISNQVIVAIIDTGVDIDHEDLASNIWTNNGEIPNDGIDNDENGYIDDINGWDFYHNDATLYSAIYDKKAKTYSSDPSDSDDHGTHCAGIIGAIANNEIGIAGVASNINIKLMPLKIEGGKKGNGSISNAIKAIKYAENMGAKVCNISWGSSQYSEALECTIKESSMLFVTAAGNTGTNNDTTPVYPASFNLDNVISVTFMNASGTLTSLSNYGKKTVDIAAPGYDIFSTVVGDSYASMSGSSMAAPHISGIAALIYAFDDHLYASNVKKILLSNYTPIASFKKKMKYPGVPNMLNIYESFNQLKSDTVSPSLDITTSYDGNAIVLNIHSNDYNGSGVRVIKYLFGEHDLSDFEHGTVGTSITSDKIQVSKQGTYSFYISDYADNHYIKLYQVKDDNKPPVIAAHHLVSNDYKKITVNAFVTDLQSGVKKVKYLKGKKTINDFKAASTGTEVTGSNGIYTFKVSSPGYYTVYAIDQRGNKAIYTINATIQKATNISINPTKCNISKGSNYTIRPLVLPSNSTDCITYKSSSPYIASITSNGVIKGLHTGTTTITISTSSGKKTTLQVTVS